MCIQHPTISTMIDRMEAGGMVKKEKDSKDKRTSRVFITTKGNEAFKQVEKIWKVMEATATKGLTEEQEKKLLGLLQLVLKNLADQK